ncbi:hypothetical protein BC835DRAFT_902410 [Cytidiella melzeri]|nr:hypothetical protein BC835DRAFT_902410 [Cytidiella melzeri]
MTRFNHILSVILFFALVGLAKAEECSAVNSLAALQSFKQPEQNLRIGPAGFYADAANGECYVLHASAAEFEEQNPTLSATYTSAIERIAEADTETLKRAQPGCGQACTPNSGCLWPCVCTYQFTLTDTLGEYDIYKCTS